MNWTLFYMESIVQISIYACKSGMVQRITVAPATDHLPAFKVPEILSEFDEAGEEVGLGSALVKGSHN